MITSMWRGNEIKCVNYHWYYTKDNTLVSENIRGACGFCSKLPTEEGHDACLGTLPGLMNACCGHGVIEDTYVQFMDGFSIHGEDAVKIIEILKRYKNENN